MITTFRRFWRWLFPPAKLDKTHAQRLRSLEKDVAMLRRDIDEHDKRLAEGSSQFGSIERRLDKLEAGQGLIENHMGELSGKVDRMGSDMKSVMSGLTTEVGLCIEYMRESARSNMTQSQIEIFEAEARAKHRHEPPKA